MDHSSEEGILLVGFGAPRRKEEVAPFLEEVARGRKIPVERLAQVARQYEALGGASPYSAACEKLREDLAAHFKARGVPLPVYLGMRSWHPFLSDVVEQMLHDGIQSARVLPLSPFQSEPSWERTLESVQNLPQVRGGALEVKFGSYFGENPLFLKAWAKEGGRLLASIPEGTASISLLFTAHSIPKDSAASLYDKQFKRAARGIVREISKISRRRQVFGQSEVAYQSRSGGKKDPWLGPTVSEVLARLPGRVEYVVALPIGFCAENAEIAYDLDVTASREARERGFIFLRVPCVSQSPYFVAALAEGLGIAHSRKE